MFEQGVDLFLNGHEHNYERVWPTYKNKTEQSNGKLIYLCMYSFHQSIDNLIVSLVLLFSESECNHFHRNGICGKPGAVSIPFVMFSIIRSSR